MMPDWIDPDAFLFKLLWQTSACLGLGLVLTSFIRHPARRHGILLLCILAAIVTPVMTIAFSSLGWGLWPAVSMNGENSMPPADLLAAVSSSGGLDLPYTRIFAGLWLALFLIMIVRLTKSCIAGAQLVAQAEPLHDEAIDNAMRIAEGRLGIRQSHQTRVSASIRCPVIWCWGRKPSILLPHSMLDHSSSSLRAVLCHELAHSKRRDHLGSFMVEFATCLLAWHPLMWIARRLASDANEQACDAWVLSTGASATNYADTLLSLIPQPASSIVLAAVHSRPALKRRIVHILGDTQASPTSGSRFLFVAVILFLVLGANASLAQRRSMDSTIANSGDRNAALPADLVAMYPIDANDPRFESMHVLPAELDLGFTDAAQAKTGSVWLVNRTQNPITVLGAKASCGCTTIEDIRDTVIAPGSSLQVEINIEPGTVPGQRKTKHVTFQFEGLDPIKIPVHVTVRDTTN